MKFERTCTDAGLLSYKYYAFHHALKTSRNICPCANVLRNSLILKAKQLLVRIVRLSFVCNATVLHCLIAAARYIITPYLFLVNLLVW